MGSTEVLSSYIKKLSKYRYKLMKITICGHEVSAKIITIVSILGHPLKEIRERSLQLLLAKLQLGWEFEDELANTRELLESLLAWFHVHQPTLQQEVLNLLLTTIKVSVEIYWYTLLYS